MTTDLGFPNLGGLDHVPVSEAPQKAKEYKSDQDVRWCPGCGDYVVLNTVQSFLPKLGLKRENIVFVSGIGCSSRFPYYMNTYGMHSIHGRAPTIATGLAISRPDLSVWVVTGDGDALSIGGNHLIHALRRNVNMTILLFNNQIYGLTKGQYSPTSEQGKVTKSTPMGSLDSPFNPVSLALGAEATFVARSIDSDRNQLSEVLEAAAEHRGSSLVEIYQNCPVFNDGAFDSLTDGDESNHRMVPLHDQEPIRFGPEAADGHGEYGVIRDSYGLAIRRVSEVGVDAVVRHDVAVGDPSYAFSLSRLGEGEFACAATGIFRKIQRPTYDDLARNQLRMAAEETRCDLQGVLHGNDTWTVSA